MNGENIILDGAPAFEKHYTVTFKAGTYQVIENTAGFGRKHWMITQNGIPYAFAFDPNAATHICLSLSLINEYLAGNGSNTGEMLAELSKLRT